MHINFLFCYNRLQPMNAINWIMILAVVHKYTDESVVDETRIHLLAMKTNKKPSLLCIFCDFCSVFKHNSSFLYKKHSNLLRSNSWKHKRHFGLFFPPSIVI